MNDAPALPVRVLVVAETEAAAKDVAVRLADVCVAAPHGCNAGDTSGPAADVVVLAFGSTDANGRHAKALRPEAGGATSTALPILVMRCGGAETAEAALLVRNGLVDDYYVAEGSVGRAAVADPHRLSTSVHVATRLVAAIRRAVPLPPSRLRPLVFVVEDDEFSRELVSATLGHDPVDLIFESDGEAAIERIRDARPDLVLMDVMLPGVDGVSLTERLKSEAALRAIPIVMLTGEAKRETLVRSLEAGAIDFVVKPFSPDALRSKIAKYLPALA